MTLIIAVIVVLNLAISWWNARICGLTAAETKAVGGWPRFMWWMAAIMSASGFTSCYLIILALGGYQAEFINQATAKLALQMGYVMIVPGILFSGLMITIDSWANAFRHGGWQNYGVAAYNTAAQLSNTYDAVQSFGPALGEIFDALSGDGDSDDEGRGVVMAVVLAVLAVGLGVLTTWAIIKSYAGSYQYKRAV